MGLFKSKPPPKRKMGLGGLVFIAIFCYVMAKNPAMLKNIGDALSSLSKSGGTSVSQIVTTSSFQSCVISHESGGDSQVWNHQGYPYWGLYQFGKPLWTGEGGQSASTWGHADAATQTQAFNNVMTHYKGCMNWYPSDGCADPSNGC